MPGGLSLAGCLANDRQGSKEIAQRHVEVSKLGDCASRGGAADNTPLHWCALAARCKFHCQLTNLSAVFFVGMRKCGSAPRQFWWEQPLDLEAAGLLASALTADSLTDDCD